jgi:dienelactone hydrolase
MATNRRELLKLAGLTGIGVAVGGMFNGYASDNANDNKQNGRLTTTAPATNNYDSDEKDISVIGLYGTWSNSFNKNRLPSFSYRNEEWTTVEPWQKAAKQRLTDRLAIPNIGGLPKVEVKKQYSYDGLHIEELSWQLPYGRPTEAILLKPMTAKGKLPGILAFHDHSANKYFGRQKITRTADPQHPMLKEHQKVEYSGLAWANEIAKRGYVVLVADAYAFASRRVFLRDVPARLRKGLNDDNPERPENIKAYNDWAFEHEHTMAKSLFSAGTTWPGVFFAEDRKALDILCAREDVDAGRIGCGGLSGGGLRTVLLAGLDPRIQCAVDIGFMTTWEDFVLNRSVDHTWMTFIPLLPNELDFPEILGLRTPLPTLVLNNSDDPFYTLPEMKRAENILSEVYKKAGAADHFKCSYYPGPHKFDVHMQAEAFNWFDRWLKA